MYQKKIKPTCKYCFRFVEVDGDQHCAGHELLEPVMDSGGTAQAIFKATRLMPNLRPWGILGWMFQLWKCPTCTYTEVHDYEPAKPQEHQSA